MNLEIFVISTFLCKIYIIMLYHECMFYYNYNNTYIQKKGKNRNKNVYHYFQNNKIWFIIFPKYILKSFCQFFEYGIFILTSVLK